MAKTDIIETNHLCARLMAALQRSDGGYHFFLVPQGQWAHGPFARIQAGKARGFEGDAGLVYWNTRKQGTEVNRLE